MSANPSDTDQRDNMLDLPLRPAGPPTPQLPVEESKGKPRAPQGAAPGPRRRYRRRKRPSGLQWAVIAALVAAGLIVGYLVFWPEPPRAGFSPDPFQPGKVRVGAAAEPDSLTITNLGERPMPVDFVTLSGAHAEEFAVAQETCGARSLEPQESCSVGLRFSPTAMGLREAAIEVHGQWRDSPARLAFSGEGIAPLLAVTPATVTFDALDVGATSPAADLVLSNEGTAPLQVTRVTLGGAADRDFRLTLNRCSKVTLSPGETCDLSVTFAPRAAGKRTAELAFGSDALEPVPTLPLAGEGIWRGAAFAVDPDSVTFGDQLVGGKASKRRIQVTNRQSSTLRGLRVALTDAAGGLSLGSRDCTARALAPGESCAIEIQFEPVAEGPVRALLQIGQPEVGTLGVEVVGRGVAPRWVTSVGSLDFAAIRVEGKAEPRRLELRNEGSAAARVSKTEFLGQDGLAFGLVDDRCTGKEIVPSSSCTLAISFAPKREGEHRSEISLHLTAGASPQRVELSGTAIAPRLGLNREIVDFGRIHRTMLERVELTISNLGTAPLAVVSLAVGDNPTGDFRLLEGSCLPTTTLSPGNRCTLVIGFEPTIEGRFTARLQIDHDGISGPRELPLAGVGLPPPVPELILAVSELDFGPQPVGERSTIQTVTIRAGGTGRLQFEGFSLEGPNASDFRIVPATCQAVPFLLPGTTCGVGVRFIPSAAGGRRARLLIRHNAGLGVSGVELSGDGLGGSPP